MFSERLLSPFELERLSDTLLGEHESLLSRARLDGSQRHLTDLAPLGATFMNRLLEEATVIIRPLKGAARELIRYWIRRFSELNLKTIIRGKKARWSTDAICKELVHIGPFESLPIDDLVRAEDLSELLRRLEKTEYRTVIRRARDRFQETGDPFWVEAVLDRQYFEGLRRKANELDRFDQRHVQVLIGLLLDEVNLVWMLRYRFGYGLTPAHSYFLLPAAGAHLSGETLSQLAKIDDFGTFLEILPGPLRDVLAGAASITEVEDRLEGARLQSANKILRYTRFNLGRALAYLMLRESQLSCIHATVRGQRLGLPVDLIREAARLEVRTV